MPEDNGSTLLTETPEAAEAAGRRTMDPELRIMGQLQRTLEELDEPAQYRAVSWLFSRYVQDARDLALSRKAGG